MKKLTPIKAIRAKCLECSVSIPYRMWQRLKDENTADTSAFCEEEFLCEEESAEDIAE